MCDVRKTAVRLVLMGLAAGLLAGALAPAKAQISKRKKTEEHTRRETNASRLARILRIATRSSAVAAIYDSRLATTLSETMRSPGRRRSTTI
jgi:hypothetical protein